MFGAITAIGAESVVISFVSFAVAKEMHSRLRSGLLSPDATLLAIGILYVALGNGFHRGFWGTARILEALNVEIADIGAYDWFKTISGITIIFLAFMIWGYGYHLQPRLECMFGAAWRQKYLAAVLSSMFGIMGLVWGVT